MVPQATNPRPWPEHVPRPWPEHVRTAVFARKQYAGSMLAGRVLTLWLVAVLGFVLVDALWPLPDVARLILLILSVFCVPLCWSWLCPGDLHGEPYLHRQARAMEAGQGLPHHPLTTALELHQRLTSPSRQTPLLPKPGTYIPGSDDHPLTRALSQRVIGQARSTLNQMPGPWSENKRSVRRLGLLLGGAVLTWLVLAMYQPDLIGGGIRRLVEPLGRSGPPMVVPHREKTLGDRGHAPAAMASRASANGMHQDTASAADKTNPRRTSQGGRLVPDLAGLDRQVRQLMEQARALSDAVDSPTQNQARARARQNWANRARQTADRARREARQINNPSVQSALRELAKTLERMAYQRNASFEHQTLWFNPPMSDPQADARQHRLARHGVWALARGLSRLRQAARASSRGRSIQGLGPTDHPPTNHPTPAAGLTSERQNATRMKRNYPIPQAINREVPAPYRDLTAAYFMSIHQDDHAPN